MSDESGAPTQALTRQAMGIEDGLPLEASQGGVEELRRNVQQLMDIEAVKQLKHAYLRCTDTANLAEMAELLHDDVTVDFVGGFYAWKLSGKQEYLDSLKKSFHREAVGHHNGHQPEIQILSETEATGIWYLTDNMWLLNHMFFTTGTALYWDRYEKVGGRWKIRSTSYRRIYEISRQLEELPPFSARYLAVHGSEVPAD